MGWASRVASCNLTSPLLLMKPFFRKAFAHLPAIAQGSHRRDKRSGVRRGHRFKQQSLVWLLILCCAVPIGLTATLATAQSDSPAPTEPSSSTETLRESTIGERKERTPPDSTEPPPSANGPEVAAPPAGDPYILEFNRSPVVGTRFSLRGIYDEDRLGFTRPRGA